MKAVLFSKLLIFLSFVGAFADDDNNNNNNKTDTSFARLRGGSPEELHHEVVNSVAQQESRELSATVRASIKSALPNKNLCINVPYADFSVGTQLQVYTCNGSDSQSFAYDVTTKQLKAAQNNLCISLPSGTAGAWIELQPCDISKGEQRWDYRDNGDLKNELYSKCADIWSESNPGQPLKSHGCSGVHHQKWTSVLFDTINNGPSTSPSDTPSSSPSTLPSNTPSTDFPSLVPTIFIDGDPLNGGPIKSALGQGLCVTVANGSVQRRADYKYGSCNGANFQHLIYDEQTMQIKNSKKDSDGRTMCMQGSTHDSYPIESIPCDASNVYQKWTFHSNGQLIQVANGRCVHAANYQEELQTRDCNGFKRQEWISNAFPVLGPPGKIKIWQDRSICLDSCDRYWDTEPCFGCWGAGKDVFITDCDSGGFFMQSCLSKYDTYQTFEYNQATNQVRHRGQCLGLSENSQVRLHPCNSNDPNQKWEYAENGDIKHVLSETCLQPSTYDYPYDTQNKALSRSGLEMVACSGGFRTKWATHVTGRRADLGYEVKGHRNLCVTVPHGSYSVGAVVKMESCDGKINQSFIYDGETKQVVPTEDQSLCLSLPGASDGTNAVLNTCDSSKDDQKWLFVPNGDARTLKNVEHRLCAQATDISGEPLKGRECIAGASNQKFESPELHAYPATDYPTPAPTPFPTAVPSSNPTPFPSPAPSTPSPTASPTAIPNIAIFQPASQSQAYENNVAEYGADNGVDGNKETHMETGNVSAAISCPVRTKDRRDVEIAYWEVNLGHEASIARIIVYNVDAHWQQVLAGALLEVKDGLGFQTEFSAILTDDMVQVFTPPPGQTFSGQIIRISHDDCFALAEVEVFGEQGAMWYLSEEP